MLLLGTRPSFVASYAGSLYILARHSYFLNRRHFYLERPLNVLSNVVTEESKRSQLGGTNTQITSSTEIQILALRPPDIYYIPPKYK